MCSTRTKRHCCSRRSVCSKTFWPSCRRYVRSSTTRTARAFDPNSYDAHARTQQIGAGPEDVELLKQTREQLEELFLLVVVGEFNAGKSAFLNAMLGKKYLKEGGALTACLPPLTHVVVVLFERFVFVGSSQHLNAHAHAHARSQ